MLTDTTKSPYAKVHALDGMKVKWTGGLWKERFDTCANSTVPQLKHMFDSKDISHVELVDGLVDAFGADQDKFKALLCAKAEEIADQVDVILLAQGSMAYAEDAIHEKIGKPVLSSPRFGAQALAAALKAKGL